MEKPSEIEFCPTSDQIFLALMKLLPPGRAFDNEEFPSNKDSIVRKFISAISLTWVKLEDAMCATLDEWFCYSASQNIDLWSFDYGIPDECDLYNASLCAKVEATHSTGSDAFVDLLAASGYSVEARWLTGHDIEFPGVRSTLRVTVDPYLSTAFTDRSFLPFRLGLDVRLGAPDAAPILCMLERYVPAHTVVDVEISGQFFPTDLGAKLLIWYNADTTVDGDVATWTDMISGLVASVVNAGQFPQSAQELVGGYRFVNSDGVDQALRTADSGVLTLGDGTLLAIVKQNSDPTDLVIRYFVSSTAGSNTRELTRTVTSATNRLLINSDDVLLADTLHDLSGMHSVAVNVGSGEVRGRVDGEDTDPASTAVGTPAGTPTEQITIFASNAGTPDGYLHGGVRHIFFTTGLTPSEFFKLEAWGAWDVNQQSTMLAPDHPYRNQRP